ncbi:MAG: hypothetical protein LBI20_04140 [Holosporales bacterium]|jgi:hypothetical protein|nr:hypothetical protein [Holosporales bacterium]
MEILQINIFGDEHNQSDEKQKKANQPVTTYKKYKDISLDDGILENSVTNDSMLIHRILQRKLIYTGLTSDKQKKAFARILDNEINIKRGKESQITATRDSLLAFFAMRYT